jgi:hypothetical protein
MDGIQMAVKIACSWSLTTNHRNADTAKDNITAVIMKKSERWNMLFSFGSILAVRVEKQSGDLLNPQGSINPPIVPATGTRIQFALSTR